MQEEKPGWWYSTLVREVRASWKEIAELKAENEILSVQVSDGLADRIGLVRAEATLKARVEELEKEPLGWPGHKP